MPKEAAAELAVQTAADRRPPRLLLKLSGEALAGGQGLGLDATELARLCREIAAAVELGAEIAIVCGGGNLFRGAGLAKAGMDRVVADQMGMLATCMNSLAIGDGLARAGVPASVRAIVPMDGLLPAYSPAEARTLLADGAVVVVAGGTGNPFFTTDTAACLRGAELQADCVLKATKVDGVYTADPVRDPGAQRFDALSFDEVLARNLGVMDLTAICLCRDHGLPVLVFDLKVPGALTKIVKGEKIGTRIAMTGAQPPAPRTPS